MAPIILAMSSNFEAPHYATCKKNGAHKQWRRVENLKQYKGKNSVEGIVTEI
jgi:hypothetical protein